MFKNKQVLTNTGKNVAIEIEISGKKLDGLMCMDVPKSKKFAGLKRSIYIDSRKQE